jgi:hypothetical protein
VGAISSRGKFVRRRALAVTFACAIFSCALEPGIAAEMAKERVETVRFADPRWPAVRVVRGVPSGVPAYEPQTAALPPFRATTANTEIVTFGDGHAESVLVVRGSGFERRAVTEDSARMETAGFSGAGPPLVNIVRGEPAPALGTQLFGAANGGELDRVAFAVEGAESGHGTTPAMWRPELDAPQGPMQVSTAAALDVGGGDRFDLRENRLLGRAFLAHMYQRYGNWPDAIVAYNWGPGHLDAWIASGRPVDKLPLETARYLLKVLRDALLINLP